MKNYSLKSMNNPTLRAYKTALRATSKAFQGDRPILEAARLKIKQGILENQLVKQPELEEQINNLNEISLFLTKNIVQGEEQKDGKYFLKFHSDIELGDNDTIKQSKEDMGSLAGKKGSAIKKCH